MRRFYKPARSKWALRGVFSYITESVFNIHNANLMYPNEDFKIYFDLFDIPGYGEKNIFDHCFIQDSVDFNENNSQYTNIESLESLLSFDVYKPNTLSDTDRFNYDNLIKKYFILNEEMKNLFLNRHSGIDFNNTIGLHRRATDMNNAHDNGQTINLDVIFNKIEQENFENIFVLCDNVFDLEKIKGRYGNRVITFEDVSTSKDTNFPFHRTEFIPKKEEDIKTHIYEIVFGAYTLGMTKKFFCTKSNLSSFTIMSNHKLNYELMN
jgi:hypothetical protein